MNREQRPRRARVLFAALAAAAVAACGSEAPTDSEQPAGEPVEQASEALLNAAASGSSPTTDAVHVTEYGTQGCTATLVTPDMALTASRCIDWMTYATDSQKNGEWWQIPEGHSWASFFGPEAGDGGNPSAIPRLFDHVPIVNGINEQIVLVAYDHLIPSSVAQPRAVQLASPTSTQLASVAVYGYETGTFAWKRSFASGDAAPLWRNYLSVDLHSGAEAAAPRDFGGPVFLGSTGGPLGGITTFINTSSVVAIETYGTGAGTWPPGPNVAAWLGPQISRTFCSAHGYTKSGDGAYRGLYQWWASGRTDHRLASEDVWRGCSTFDRKTQDGYQYAYEWQEGWIDDASNGQAPGTVPLWIWYSSARGDYATTTWTSASGYTPVALAGYIWTSPASDRVALHLEYSSTLGDYLTSTRVASGYLDTGVIGYVRRPELSTPSPVLRDVNLP